MNRNATGPSFTTTRVTFTVLYIAVVAADHLTTLLHTSQGGMETNFLFRASDGTLAQKRAVILFVLLWPVLASSVWVGCKRAASGDAAFSHPLWDRFYGRTALSALMLPVVVILAKALVAVLNLVTWATPFSPSRFIKALLLPAGLWSWQLGYLITASIVLLASATIARPLIRRWLARIQSHSDIQRDRYA